MTKHDPTPSRASKQAVHAFAEHIASQLAFEPGDPITPIVSRLGGHLVYKNAIGYEAKLPESIVVRSRNDFTIFVSSMTSPERDRFTIAHELGHLFLHFPLIEKAGPGHFMVATRWVNENNPDAMRAEWEANWFAAGFLMPEQKFREAWRRYQNSSHVAGLFGVSGQAAEVRAKNLGLLS